MCVEWGNEGGAVHVDVGGGDEKYLQLSSPYFFGGGGGRRMKGLKRTPKDCDLIDDSDTENTFVIDIYLHVQN